MRYINKLLCFFLVIAMCMSCAVPVFAKTVQNPTYGPITIDSYEVPRGAVRVITIASQNPDNATLRNGIQFSTGTELSTHRNASSSGNVTSFIYDFPINGPIDDHYVYAFCSHEIYLSLSNAFYATTEVALS